MKHNGGDQVVNNDDGSDDIAAFVRAYVQTRRGWEVMEAVRCLTTAGNMDDGKCQEQRRAQR